MELTEHNSFCIRKCTLKTHGVFTSLPGRNCSLLAHAQNVPVFTELGIWAHVSLGLFWDPKLVLSEAQPCCCLAGSAIQCCDCGHWVVPHCPKEQGTPVAAGLGLVSRPGKEETEQALYL